MTVGVKEMNVVKRWVTWAKGPLLGFTLEVDESDVSVGLSILLMTRNTKLREVRIVSLFYTKNNPAIQ